ncbi:MAG: F0F1 ATP synthase subunit A [Clostridia bacterium]|nr:F0F1 ATP synthase subunit A [Clostridia bacterium]MBQ2903871.1 F0F1 ATP synthase subunit A [Clostridia bacterium]MBQ3006234.1 F0F1 ATP synthase subunit A [Clostridia bacterium]MBQ4604032.1 F0F1 ATP synthase subunit A [Clostridia bacterium]MBQ9849581.1 F0F1 ATP synthase subunit A [Clostridia bacterium]
MGEKSEVIISLFGILDVTGEVITMWIMLLVIALLSLIVKKNLKERPGKFQNIIETGIEYLDNFFSDILGKKKSRKYFTFLASLFIFIIFSNYSGLIPGVGLTDYVKAPTASLSVTAALGVVTFLFLQISGIRHNAKHYFKHFVKPMFFMLPLLVLDEIIKPASLALRLYGNIFGEETVTEELYHIFPIGAPVVMMVLSLLFCALQAMVFTMLVSIYLDEVTE